MSATYRLTKPAAADLQNIYEYTAETWGYDQAHRYLANLQQRLTEIAEHPQLGRDCSHLRRGARSRVAEDHVAYYILMDRTVVILRVLHPRQLANKQKLAGR